MSAYKPSLHVPWEQVIFERLYLDETGRYIGTDLRAFAFPFAPGEFIPQSNRYGAARAHIDARQSLQNFGR